MTVRYLNRVCPLHHGGYALVLDEYVHGRLFKAAVSILTEESRDEPRSFATPDEAQQAYHLLKPPQKGRRRI